MMKKILLSVLRAYKYFISPIFPNSCRFIPTCSEYSQEAIDKHGAIKGSYMAIKRIFRCHPFHHGGYDPL